MTYFNRKYKCDYNNLHELLSPMYLHSVKCNRNSVSFGQSPSFNTRQGQCLHKIALANESLSLGCASSYLFLSNILCSCCYCCGQCTIANNTNRIVATRKSDEEDNRKQNFLFGSSIWKCYSMEHVPSPVTAAEARGSMRIICLGATDQETICLLLFFSPRNVKE